jgi:hypothetical protein
VTAQRPNWYRHMVIARFEGVDPERRDLVVELRCDDQVLGLISSRGRVHLVTGPATASDVTLSGPTEGVVGLLLGRVARAEAEARGASASRRVRALDGLRPRGEAPEPVRT